MSDSEARTAIWIVALFAGFVMALLVFTGVVLNERADDAEADIDNIMRDICELRSDLIGADYNDCIEEIK